MRRMVSLLAITGLLPIIVLGAGFGAATLINERSALGADVDGRTRFSAALIGRELAADKRATDMMAQSPAFDDHFDAERFGILATRLVARQPGWKRIRVSDVAGNTLLEVPKLAGRAPPSRVIDTASFAWTVSHRLPDIGRVVPGAGGSFAFPVRAPVIRAGRVTHVVTTVVPAMTLNALLADQGLPASWRAEIVDGDGRVVASTGSAGGAVGSPASVEAIQARRDERPNLYSSARFGGAVDIATWARVPATNWTVHVAAPSQLFAAPLHHAIMLVIVAGILSLLLFFILLRLLVRELQQSRLRDAAEVQGQRMEALGRLTGGVAHDFNNLLTPIVGGLDLLRRRLGEDPKSLRYIDAASQSAERARLLVARLLSYSRRQPLAPRNIDLAEMLDGLMDLLERSTGPAISFDVRCAQDLPPAFADAGQLELAILNLVINARDAMPEGGLIVIEAMLREADEGLKLEPGSYIALSVSDQGTGMDDATLRNAIEPFFTTKPVERGTGLGLSMVHGFAAQSGGVLDLSSVVGEGTRVTIWLPKGRSSASKSQRIGGKETTAALPGGGAAIMLVDDEADVRSIAAESLISAGYSVIEAGSVREAVEALEKGALVDLVVTDYLMPGGTGARLVNRVRSDWPHIPIIVLSGYMENAVDLDPSISRLAKPYAIGELLNAIRLALGTAVDDTNSAC